MSGRARYMLTVAAALTLHMVGGVVGAHDSRQTYGVVPPLPKSRTTRFVEALQADDIGRMRALMRRGIHLNRPIPEDGDYYYKCSYLGLAAFRKLGTVRFLVERGAGINTTFQLCDPSPSGATRPVSATCSETCNSELPRLIPLAAHSFAGFERLPAPRRIHLPKRKKSRPIGRPATTPSGSVPYNLLLRRHHRLQPHRLHRVAKLLRPELQAAYYPF